MNSEIIEFLKQSNYIEAEYSDKALSDAKKAWEFLIGEDNLNTLNILKIHDILMESRELQKEYKGKYRRISVMIGGKICPCADEIPERMDRWLVRAKNTDFANADLETRESIIKEMHVQFEKIHPFVDGNGRIGRIIMNWQRIKNGLLVLIIKEGYEQREYYKWFR